jgi:hypothetical protein
MKEKLGEGDGAGGRGDGAARKHAEETKLLSSFSDLLVSQFSG